MPVANLKANSMKKVPSPFSKTSQHGKKYKTILSAASELFNVYGTRGTTLIQIAQKLNLTKTSLYYYAKNKEELVYQCYLNTCTELQEMLDESKSADGLAINKLETLLKLNFDCWVGIINRTRTHLAGLTEIASLSVTHQAEISERYRTFVLQVMDILNEGQLDGSIQKVDNIKAASAIWGAIFWLPVWLPAVDTTQRRSAFNDWQSIIKYGLHNSDSPFTFLNTKASEQALSIDGFDRNEQNRIKQEAFYKVGTAFFNQKGFKGTSLDELAQSLGVTKGAFYYHIQNKDDLLIKCFERTIAIEREVLQQALSKNHFTGIEKLAFAAQHLFAIQVGEQGPLIRYARMWSLDLETRQKIEVQTSDIRDFIGEIIELGLKDESIKSTALLVAENIVAGAIESIPDLGDNINLNDVSKDSANFFHIFFNGIAT